MRNKFLGTGDEGYHPLRKIKVVLAGLRFAFRYDFSVAYKIVLSSVIIALALVFQQWVDFAMILLATGLVLTAELLNSAIETLCDFLEPRENAKIGAIKDIAAAAVGISIVVWVVVVVFDVIHLGSALLGRTPA
ncbi:MAG: diacylglycerol kinase [Desulfobacterales bacterium]|jgi:diacylglycerol kinase (ATP)|nr:diacylglycerol kinase [Desulfobacterales bacterium]